MWRINMLRQLSPSEGYSTGSVWKQVTARDDVKPYWRAQKIKI
jgi:hypothetical protein